MNLRSTNLWSLRSGTVKIVLTVVDGAVEVNQSLYPVYSILIVHQKFSLLLDSSHPNTFCCSFFSSILEADRLDMDLLTSLGARLPNGAGGDYLVCRYGVKELLDKCRRCRRRIRLPELVFMCIDIIAYPSDHWRHYDPPSKPVPVECPSHRSNFTLRKSLGADTHEEFDDIRWVGRYGLLTPLLFHQSHKSYSRLSLASDAHAKTSTPTYHPFPLSPFLFLLLSRK